MARFLLVLQPRSASETGHQGEDTEERGSGKAPEGLLRGLEPVLQQLNAEVDHRTSAHIGALLRHGGDSQRMQLFADVQSKPGGGQALELMLLSREAMGLGAPQTLAVLEKLVALCQEHLQHLHLVFRSDRDGPLPAPRTAVTA